MQFVYLFGPSDQAYDLCWLMLICVLVVLCFMIYVYLYGNDNTDVLLLQFTFALVDCFLFYCYPDNA